MSIRSNSSVSSQARRKSNEPRGRLWICTTSFESKEVDPFQSLRENQIYVKGQLEKGEGGYIHWQWTLHCGNPIRLGRLKSWFPTTHFELSRSSAAESYCEKEESLYLCAPKTTATKVSTAYSIGATTKTSGTVQDYISDPVQAWAACQGVQFNQTINVSNSKTEDLYMSPMSNPLFTKNFKVEETTVVLEPGQSYSYFIGGPSNFEVNFEKMFKPQTIATPGTNNTAQAIFQGIQKWMRCPMITVYEDLVQDKTNLAPGRMASATADTYKNLGLVIERDMKAKYSMPEQAGGTIQDYSIALSTTRTIQLNQRRSAYFHAVYSLTQAGGYWRYDEEVPTVKEDGS